MEADERKRGAERLSLRIKPDVYAPAVARRALRELPLGERADDVLLLASELVTNAVLHAGLDPDEPIELHAACDESHAHVEVRDPGAGFAHVPGAGFGLRIVEATTHRWGIEHDHQTRVWFDVPMGRGGFEPPSVGL
jgi:anti-sigma regulatory factor (Ser/Thr protein kinase)